MRHNFSDYMGERITREVFIDDVVGRGRGHREENNAFYAVNASRFLSDFYSSLPNIMFDVYIILENGVVHSIREQGRVWPGTTCSPEDFKYRLRIWASQESKNPHATEGGNKGPFTIKMFFANARAREDFGQGLTKYFPNGVPYYAAAGKSVNVRGTHKPTNNEELVLNEYRMVQGTFIPKH